MNEGANVPVGVEFLDSLRCCRDPALERPCDVGRDVFDCVRLWAGGVDNPGTMDVEKMADTGRPVAVEAVEAGEADDVRAKGLLRRCVMLALKAMAGQMHQQQLVLRIRRNVRSPPRGDALACKQCGREVGIIGAIDVI